MSTGVKIALALIALLGIALILYYGSAGTPQPDESLNLDDEATPPARPLADAPAADPETDVETPPRAAGTLTTNVLRQLEDAGRPRPNTAPPLPTEDPLDPEDQIYGSVVPDTFELETPDPEGTFGDEPATEPEADTPSTTPDRPGPRPEPKRTYIVERNDTLMSIAKAVYGNPLAFVHIERANPGIDPERLQIGQELVLPILTDADRRPRRPDDDRIHLVTRNDTLSTIAREHYGTATAWQAIYRANRDVIGPDPNTLVIGMRLRLPELDD